MARDYTGMRRLDLAGGACLGFHDAGRGDTLLLLHGGVFSDWFLPLCGSSRLSGFRVVRVRRSGYMPPAGAATQGPHEPQAGAKHLSIADHARHAARLLDALDAAPAHVVGHSSGGVIGLQLALERPDLVRSLVLLEPAASGGPRGPDGLRFTADVVSPAMDAFAAGDLPAAFDIFMRGIGGPGYADLLTSRLGSGAVATACAQSQFFFADEIGAVRDWRFGPRDAAAVTQPTVLVLGGESRRLTPIMAETAAELAAILPNAHTATLPGCNHTMMLQDPVAVSRLIADFARSAKPAS